MFVDKLFWTHSLVVFRQRRDHSFNITCVFNITWVDLCMSLTELTYFGVHLCMCLTELILTLGWIYVFVPLCLTELTYFGLNLCMCLTELTYFGVDLCMCLLAGRQHPITIHLDGKPESVLAIVPLLNCRKIDRVKPRALETGTSWQTASRSASHSDRSNT